MENVSKRISFITYMDSMAYKKVEFMVQLITVEVLVKWKEIMNGVG